MYDFEGTDAGTPSARLSRPPLLLTALEAVRLAVELPELGGARRGHPPARRRRRTGRCSCSRLLRHRRADRPGARPPQAPGLPRVLLGPGPQPRPHRQDRRRAAGAARRGLRAAPPPGEHRRLELRRPARPLAGARAPRPGTAGRHPRARRGGPRARSPAPPRCSRRRPGSTACPAGRARSSTRCASPCRCRRRRSGRRPTASSTGGPARWTGPRHREHRRPQQPRRAGLEPARARRPRRPPRPGPGAPGAVRLVARTAALRPRRLRPLAESPA